MTDKNPAQHPASNYSPEKFEQAMDRRMLKKAPPKLFRGNRSQAERVFTEDELNANARTWFQQFEEQIGFYEKLGHDLQWVVDWTKNGGGRGWSATSTS